MKEERTMVVLSWQSKGGKVAVFVSSLLLVVVLGMLDYRSGPEISFSIFYLVPVALVALYVGRWLSVFVSLAAACTWLLADVFQHQYTMPWIAYWNAGVRLGFFLAVGILVSAWKAVTEQLRGALQTKSNALAAEIADHRRTEQELAQSEERFRQAQKMEALGRLAGGIAHDIRNQMTVISGYCQLLLAGLNRSDPLRTSLEEIHRAGRRITTLTSQLLAFSRKEILRPEVTSFNRVLIELKSSLEKIIGEDIQLSVIPASDLGNVNIDAVPFQQAVMNLAVNARDAMPDGGRLTLETANVRLDEHYARQRGDVKPGQYVMVAISDTGMGMPDEIKRHLFEPFFTTKPAGRGTGLGLAMVYGFVKQSGGHIAVYSEPNRGTTFKLYFPRVAAEEKVPERPAEAEPTPHGTETILVVEDDESIRKVASTLLERLGYKVLSARAPSVAISLAQKGGTIDMLLTDVIMPEMSGPQLATKLLALLPHLKVVYMTGYAENAIIHHGVVDPGVNLVTKPFGPDELGRIVRRVLDRQ